MTSAWPSWIFFVLSTTQATIGVFCAYYIGKRFNISEGIFCLLFTESSLIGIVGIIASVLWIVTIIPHELEDLDNFLCKWIFLSFFVVSTVRFMYDAALMILRLFVVIRCQQRLNQKVARHVIQLTFHPRHFILLIFHSGIFHPIYFIRNMLGWPLWIISWVS